MWSTTKSSCTWPGNRASCPSSARHPIWYARVFRDACPGVPSWSLREDARPDTSEDCPATILEDDVERDRRLRAARGPVSRDRGDRGDDGGVAPPARPRRRACGLRPAE